MPYKFIKTGKIYHGQWKEGKTHGFGKIYWKDGSIF